VRVLAGADRRGIASADVLIRAAAVLSIEERFAQYLLNALYVAGTIVEHEAASGRAQLRPTTADEFHIVLVREVLDALEHESEADAHFVQEMRNVWGIARRD